jgi:hypothetical protein
MCWFAVFCCVKVWIALIFKLCLVYMFETAALCCFKNKEEIVCYV